MILIDIEMILAENKELKETNADLQHQIKVLQAKITKKKKPVKKEKK